MLMVSLAMVLVPSTRRVEAFIYSTRNWRQAKWPMFAFEDQQIGLQRSMKQRSEVLKYQDRGIVLRLVEPLAVSGGILRRVESTKTAVLAGLARAVLR